MKNESKNSFKDLYANHVNFNNNFIKIISKKRFIYEITVE